MAANLYSFIGYGTFSVEEIVALPLADKAVLFFIDWFIEGKFYGIFSILFGLGFALQAERFQHADDSFLAFWHRRMGVLCIMGLLHMYFIWNGDILTLYSLLGMLLPLFMNFSNKALMRWVLFLLAMPLVMHVILYLTPEASFWGSLSRVSADLKTAWGYGDLTLLEMRTSDNPVEVFHINILVAIPRAMSYLMFGRYFHVMGLFLIGLLIARHWLPKIRNKDISVPKIAIWFGLIGLVSHFFYALIKAQYGWPSGFSEEGLLLGFIYHIGSTAFSLAIAMLVVYLWASGKATFAFENLVYLGRMALTNYIFQNVIAILLFFGYGLALMRKVPFATLPLFALGILTLQWLFSRAWLKRFKQGPLEYLWRKLTYRSAKAK